MPDGSKPNAINGRLKAVLPFFLLIFCPALIGWCALVFWTNHDKMLALCLTPRSLAQLPLFDLVVQNLNAESSSEWLKCTFSMTAAMALPLALLPAMRITATTFEPNRMSQCAIFLAAYCIVWLVLMGSLALAGFVFPGLLLSLYSAAPWSPILLTLVALYRLTPEARTALKRCHRISPIRVFSPFAQIDALKMGAISALRCARFCWPAMLLPWFVTRPLFTMFTTTALAIAERHSLRPKRFAVLVVLISLAGVEWLIPAR